MAKKTSDPSAAQQKGFVSPDEISQSIVKLRARIHQVEELKKDGLPYRDALKVTAEYQIRDTIREIFGEHSPEYLDHQHLKIKITSRSSINETISRLQQLVVSLEEKRLEMLGLRAKPATDEKGQPNGAKVDATAVKTLRPCDTNTHPVTAPVAPREDMVEAAPASTEEPAPNVPTPPAGFEEAGRSPAHRAFKQVPMKLKLSAEVPLPAHGERVLHERPAGEIAVETAVEPGGNAVVSHPQPPESNMAQTVPGPVPQDHAHKVTQDGVVEPDGTASGAHDTTAPLGVSASHDPDVQVEGDIRSAVDVLRQTCQAFHRVARQLRQRRDDRPTLEVEDERDVIDLLHALLKVRFDQIETEEWTPSYAAGTSQTALSLKPTGVVVMAKKTKPGMNAKVLTQQLNEDFERYAAYPECKALFCFIYDPEGRIGNPQALEGDLTLNYNRRRVETFISPK